MKVSLSINRLGLVLGVLCAWVVRDAQAGPARLQVRTHPKPSEVFEGQALLIDLWVYTHKDIQVDEVHWPQPEGIYSLLQSTEGLPSQVEGTERVHLLERRVWYAFSTGLIRVGPIEASGAHLAGGLPGRVRKSVLAAYAADATGFRP